MISFFHTPKPRQFKYRPRFYDPEREEFEELRKKYEAQNTTSFVDDETLNYYKKRVHSFDSENTHKSSGFFSKKPVPKFNYQPRFLSTKEAENKFADNKIEFKPMFSEDKNFAERVPLRQIIISIVVILLLLLWIFS